MKNHIFFILYFTIISLYAQKNTGLVNYKIFAKPSFIKKNDSSKVGRMFNDSAKHFKRFEFELLFNDTESLFKIKKDLSLDVEETLSFKSAKLFSGGNETFYINKDSNLKVRQKPFLGDLFLIKSLFTSTSWDITKESKEIEGFNCYKASTMIRKNKTVTKDKNIIAWFCPDIPVSYGPKGYGGLPGLILELHEGNIIYFANKIKLSNEQIFVNKPVKGINMSAEEYEDYVIKKIEDSGFNRKI